ncbi:zinc-dependent alcohol dehydrogenase family protein [Paraburkholderia bannensis]|uniref:zinc-dependent alcohol dehydrogenase family protein n=1 Tax=Paraburkholderia bannensis TaxID=765414 RepID=UPI002ABE59F7|nr:zinc-dependent alcohol dehydrogenase family protein [Paraburkholderia bannensis]
MRAMVFDGESPVLCETQLPDPSPREGQLLIDVAACGVCRTDLHVIDADLESPKRPLIPGHEIVGRVAALGRGVTGFAIGDCVGVPWLGHTCGHCRFCVHGRENLCDAPGFTGYTIDGGYATRTVADARYCLHLPRQYSHAEAAPLLCAGLIGFRSLVMAGDAERIGIYGFGAAGHIVAQVAQHQGREVYAFTSPGDVAAQEFARRLGVVWAGGSDQRAPVELDAALLFAPVGDLVPVALRALVKGGTVVCGGIHMSDIPSFPYAWLWGERRIVSVANLTREDGIRFMNIAGKHKLSIQVTEYPLSSANQALADLREGRLTGAAVLTMD